MGKETPSTPGPVRRALAAILWIAVTPALALFLAAWLTPARLDSTDTLFTAWSFAAFMARTFTFHAGLALTAACLLAAALRARRLMIFSGLLGTLIVISAAVRIPAVAAKTAGGDSLTIFSHNLLFINNDMTRVLAQIEASDPDVICFQEYTPAHHAALAPALAAEYPHAVHQYRDNFYGQAVYSKRPFVGEPAIVLESTTSHGTHPTGNGPQIRVRVLLGDQTVTIQNIHTDAPGSLGIYRAQRRQFTWLRDLSLAAREPLVLVGDFNATNASQHISALRDAGLADALDVRAVGRGCTWPDRTVLQWLPGIRIDHTLYSRGLECEAAHVGTSTGSDHLPVIARLRIKHTPQYEDW